MTPQTMTRTHTATRKLRRWVRSETPPGAPTHAGEWQDCGTETVTAVVTFDLSEILDRITIAAGRTKNGRAILLSGAVQAHVTERKVQP